MVIDTSALIAILLAEAEAAQFAEAIASAPRCLIGTGTWVETAVVITARRGDAGRIELDNLVNAMGAEIVPFDRAQAELARNAWCRFGKGRHAVGLNFGDLFAYALATLLAEPLLFKGDDFSQTDIAPALS